MILSKLPYYKAFDSKLGSKTGAVVYTLLLVVVVVVVYRLVDEGLAAVRNAIGTKDQRKLRDYLTEQVGQTADGITPNDSEISGFEAEAQVIADMQFAAMEGPGTNLPSLFNQIIDLEGWQLVMVAEKFGIRPYSNILWSQELSIFGWYDQELCDNCTTCLQYKDERVPGCTDDDTTFWCNGCTERNFMRAIWAKSGIPN